MSKVTAVVLTKNEEDNLSVCLESISWADEIVVIDDYSSDNTFNVARKHGAKIFERRLNNNFAQQRNFGLTKAKNKWVLFIDADEVVSSELKNSIKQILKHSINDGYTVVRKNYFHQKELNYGEWGRTELVRIGRKKAGIWQRAVHEYWAINDVGRLNGTLIHYSPKNIKDFVSKLGRYSKLHAEENIREGKNANSYKVIVYPLGKFIKNYLLKQGYKDGIQGFIMAVMMSFHSFLAWGQLWLLKR